MRIFPRRVEGEVRAFEPLYPDKLNFPYFFVELHDEKATLCSASGIFDVLAITGEKRSGENNFRIPRLLELIHDVDVPACIVVKAFWKVANRDCFHLREERRFQFCYAAMEGKYLESLLSFKTRNVQIFVHLAFQTYSSRRDSGELRLCFWINKETKNYFSIFILFELHDVGKYTCGIQYVDDRDSCRCIVVTAVDRIDWNVCRLEQPERFDCIVHDREIGDADVEDVPANQNEIDFLLDAVLDGVLEHLALYMPENRLPEGS